MAKQIIAVSPSSVKATKKVINSMDRDARLEETAFTRDVVSTLKNTDDFKEGVNAFVEKGSRLEKLLGRKMPKDTISSSFVDMNNLEMSNEIKPLFDKVVKHIKENVDPISDEFYKLAEENENRWHLNERQLELLEEQKIKQKESGLWNFFLPNAETGEGLSNLDYAYIAAELGKNPLASETLNCSAPDTGNMEVLERVGTPEQKRKMA